MVSVILTVFQTSKLNLFCCNLNCISSYPTTQGATCSFHFGSSCLCTWRLWLSQPSLGCEIPVLPRFPCKLCFSKALIILIVLIWTPPTCPTLFWRHVKLHALFQQKPLSVLSTGKITCVLRTMLLSVTSQWDIHFYCSSMTLLTCVGL